MKNTDMTMREPTTQNMKVLLEENAALKRRVEWFERQVFGQKSEKRPVDHSLQHSLLGDAPNRSNLKESKNKSATPGGKPVNHDRMTV